jgi:hypothetical protein
LDGLRRSERDAVGSGSIRDSDVPSGSDFIWRKDVRLGFLSIVSIDEGEKTRCSRRDGESLIR